jgi:hypothetical protein
MVMEARGLQVDEASVREDLGALPYGLARAARYGTYYFLDPDKAEDVAFLRAQVQAGPCLVTVCGGPAAHQARHLTTPHPPLAKMRPGQRLEDVGVPHHVIVLVSAGHNVEYYDPYFNAPGQPLGVPMATFLACWWTGSLLGPGPVEEPS